MNKFIKHISIFSLAFIIVVTMYIILDPYKVIWHYDSYIESGTCGTIVPNIDYVSTTTFDQNYDKLKYNSFIFGNSRSIFYEIDTWKNYIDKDASCYHFDASGESLYGIYLKVRYIQNKNIKIDNCLLVLDRYTLKKIDSHVGVLFMKAPQLEDNETLLSFHKTTFLACLKWEFVMGYISYKVFGKIENNAILNPIIRDYDVHTNEIRYLDIESRIKQNSISFYNADRMEFFYARDSIQTYSDSVITDNQIYFLHYIKTYFDRCNTNYKVIISPLYDQKKINVNDLEKLKTIFGDNRVFDFSGINEMTQDYHNYYENSHYRPHVAAEIMKIIYTP